MHRGQIYTTLDAIRKGKQLSDIPREEWWSTADARTLEEEVVKARRGLGDLFQGTV